MPYDPSGEPILQAVASGRRRFHGALRTTAEDLGRRVAAAADRDPGSMSSGLGPFGDAYVDADRWREMFRPSTESGRDHVVAFEAAHAVLTELLAAGDDIFVTRTRPHQRADEAVRDALAAAGRAFGAARIARAVRDQRHRPDETQLLESFPFAHWNRSERDLAPPIVVALPGEAIRAGALTEFLDGNMKIVLVVTGECPPAPLVRVITPRVYVQQVTRPEDLSLDAFDGPAIAAVVPDGAAVFTYDPARAATGDPPLEVEFLPGVGPRRPVGGMSGAQQNDELQMLARMVSSEPVTVSSPESDDRPVEPADRLAAWLLSAVDVEIDT